ncbi:MAG: hypothetical protein M3Q45_08500 [Chloroflexota bacterium]|nr:hypothetical protein [Chloroflexota bacterium]
MAKQQLALRTSANLPTRFERIGRSLFLHPVQHNVYLGNSATLNAQVWLGQFPWRPTAAWAVLTAMLASGLIGRRLEFDWKTVALLLLLVDTLWGGIWRLAAGRAELLPLHTQSMTQEVWLPYLRPGSPAARLLGWNDAGALPLLFRVALPTVLMTVAVAVVLNRTAVWLTGVVILLGILGWISRHALARTPALLHSLVTIALPWALTLTTLGTGMAAEQRARQLTLLLLWVLHNWGEGRILRSGGDWVGLALLAVAEISIITLFVLIHTPLWLAPLLVLWLPAWLLVAQGQPVQRANGWWLGALLLSGLALGNS